MSDKKLSNLDKRIGSLETYFKVGLMVLCERKPPEAFSQELTKFTGKSTSAPQIEIIVQEWKTVWAPWLAGLQAIQPWSG